MPVDVRLDGPLVLLKLTVVPPLLKTETPVAAVVVEVSFPLNVTVPVVTF